MRSSALCSKIDKDHGVPDGHGLFGLHLPNTIDKAATAAKSGPKLFFMFEWESENA